MTHAAFQSDAFQNSAFQIHETGGGACTPAFQTNAFQVDAFQTCTDTQSQSRGGGWLETAETSRARREYERRRREEWRKLEREIEEAYADATGQTRKAVKPIVRKALAEQNPATVERLARQLAQASDPAALALVERIEARLNEIRTVAALLEQLEYNAMLMRRDEDDAIAVLMMVN